MVITSDRFHEAIRSDAPQTPLFIFDGGVVTKNDIDLSSGFRFQEAVMDGDDFEPGACCSSTLDFQLMNEDGEWSAFPFGDFTAYLGAQTFHRREKQRKGCVVLVGGNTIQGSDQPPYLTLNGQTVAGADAPPVDASLEPPCAQPEARRARETTEATASARKRENGDRVTGFPFSGCVDAETLSDSVRSAPHPE